MATMTSKEPTKADREFAARLFNLRKHVLDISQEEMAAQVGVSLSTWTSWELCRRVPSPISKQLLKTLFPKHLS